MIPPPNVTGSLHMGHGFAEAIMDASSATTGCVATTPLWQVGTDHAGIATQMVVERQLAAQGISRHDLGAGKFVAKVWEWKENPAAPSPASCAAWFTPDWSRERFTMDPGLSGRTGGVHTALPRGASSTAASAWSTGTLLHTAISDLEVVAEEEQVQLWHFNYPLAGGEGPRDEWRPPPETMLGDTAVAVHPADERYSHLIGRMVALPLTGSRDSRHRR